LGLGQWEGEDCILEESGQEYWEGWGQWEGEDCILEESGQEYWEGWGQWEGEDCFLEESGQEYWEGWEGEDCILGVWEEPIIPCPYLFPNIPSHSIVWPVGR
jgi:hypothetical protein